MSSAKSFGNGVLDVAGFVSSRGAGTGTRRASLTTRVGVLAGGRTGPGRRRGATGSPHGRRETYASRLLHRDRRRHHGHFLYPSVETAAGFTRPVQPRRPRVARVTSADRSQPATSAPGQPGERIGEPPRRPSARPRRCGWLGARSRRPCLHVSHAPGSQAGRTRPVPEVWNATRTSRAGTGERAGGPATGLWRT